MQNIGYYHPRKTQHLRIDTNLGGEQLESNIQIISLPNRPAATTRGRLCETCSKQPRNEEADNRSDRAFHGCNGCGKTMAATTILHQDFVTTSDSLPMPEQPATVNSRTEKLVNTKMDVLVTKDEPFNDSKQSNPPSISTTPTERSTRFRPVLPQSPASLAASLGFSYIGAERTTYPTANGLRLRKPVPCRIQSSFDEQQEATPTLVKQASSTVIQLQGSRREREEQLEAWKLLKPRTAHAGTLSFQRLRSGLQRAGDAMRSDKFTRLRNFGRTHSWGVEIE